MFSQVGYSPDAWTLTVEFKNGTVLTYQDICPEVADEFLSAESLGKYYGANIKGKFTAISEEKLPKPKETAPKPVAAPAPDLGITEEDIRSVDPTYNADGLSPQQMIEEPTTYPTYGGIERGDAIHWKSQEGKVHTYPASEGEAFQATDIANISKPEIMPEWETPENAYHALELLSERETEIDAIIEQNKRVGADALLVKVGDADSRVKAATLLTSLVENKDRTIELLDPFRKVLYESYEYAAGKKKAALDPIEGAIKQVKLRCTTWDDEQRRQKQEADRKAREAADAEARRRQEEERQRLTLAEVDDKLEQGDEQGAQLVFDAPIDVPKPYVEPMYMPAVTPTIEGHSSSQKWKVDEAALESEQDYAASIMALLRAVRNDQIEMRMAASYLKWDIVSLNKLAGALRNAFSVPGLSAKPVTNLRVARNK